MPKITVQAFDIDAAREHLSWIADEIHLVSIHKIAGKPVRAHRFGTDIEAALNWAMAENKEQRGIYFTINRVPIGFHAKPSEADIVACRFVHVDIDPPKSGAEFNFGETIETLEGLQCPPSFIIGSGAGVQALWRIDDSRNVEAVKAINFQVRDMFNADACQNVDRLFRLSGTVNWPNAAKEARGRKPSMACIISADNGLVYEPHVLAATFPQTELREEIAERATVDIVGVKLLTCDDLNLTPFSPLRLAVEKPRGNDRSAYGYHAACEGVRAGYSDQQIAGLLLNPANAAAAHFLDQSMPQRAVARALGQAHGVEPDAVVVSEETREAVAAIGVARKAEPTAVQVPVSDKPEWYAGMTPGIKQYVDTVMEYAPSPRIELALASAIACFATAAGRRYQSPTGILTNIYCTALMASGAGKDFPLRTVGQVLTRAGAIDVVGGRIVSATGVRSALEKQPTLFVPIDEMGKLIQAMNNPRGNLKDAVAMLLELYSESQSFTKGGMYANNNERQTVLIHNPCLSFFGVATPSTFWEGLTSGSVSDGFLPRMVLFIDNDVEPEPRLDLARARWPDSLIDHVKAVRCGAEGHITFPMGEGAEMQPKPYDIPYANDAAKQAWFAMKLKEREMRLANPAEKHPFYNRLAENATKIAMVRAIDRTPDRPELTEGDFAWGEMLSMRSIMAFEKHITDSLADNDHHARVNRIRQIIVRAGDAGISVSEIGRLAQGIAMRERRDILEDLEEQGAVVSAKVDTGGRARFVYRST